MWTLSVSPWASSTQSGPCWCCCGLCPHVHRRGIPSFACCLRGGVALCIKESTGLALGCQIEGRSAFSPGLAAKKSQEEGGGCRLWDSASQSWARELRLQSPQCLSAYLLAKCYLKTSSNATSPGEPPFILSQPT